MTAPMHTTASSPPRRTTWRSTCGISNEPGHQNTDTSSSRPPVRTTASMAPLTMGSTIRALKRPHTIPMRSPTLDRIP
jgi:hypothetical protein